MKQYSEKPGHWSKVMHIRKWVAFILGFAVVSSPTVVTAASASFSGSYLGGNIGAFSGISNYKTNPGCVSPGADGVFCNSSPDPSAINGSAVSTNGTGKRGISGFTGGVQAGHNWQKKMLVLGGEADFGVFNLNKFVRSQGAFPYEFLGTRYNLTESIATNWLATLRGRIGWIIHPQFLLYATGGSAFTNYKVSSSYRDNAVSVNFPGGSGYGSRSQNKAGWTAGGGAEYLFTEHFSIKAEYLYVDFGPVNVFVPTSNTPVFTQAMQVSTHFNTHMVRFGLNYQFG